MQQIRVSGDVVRVALASPLLRILTSSKFPKRQISLNRGRVGMESIRQLLVCKHVHLYWWGSLTHGPYHIICTQLEDFSQT